MNGGLNIAALSRRTGVAADTIRKWEQRYGVLRPERTPGGQRRYTEADVARVRWLNDRLAEGYRIGEAAAMLGAGAGEPAHDTDDLLRELVAAVRERGFDEVTRLLDRAFALHALSDALTRVVAPLLEQIGEQWATGDLTVGDEHLVTAIVRNRIEAQLVHARGGTRGLAVLACAPGERHELGLLMLAVLLRADGWQVAFLGGDTPVPDALDLSRRLDARLLCFSTAGSESAARLRDDLRAEKRPRGLKLVIGGAAASRALATDVGAAHVNSDLPQSVRALRKLST